jgi:hypothetical protein
MPTDFPAFKTAFEMPDLLQRDAGGTLRCPITLERQTVLTATGGTCTLARPDGSTLKTGAITPDATYSAVFALSAGELAGEAFGMGYLVTWALSFAEGDITTRNQVGIVRVAPAMPADEGDLLSEIADLNRELEGLDQTSWDPDLLDAWYRLNRWLNKQGNRAHLVIQPHDLKDLHRLWALKVITGKLGGNDREGSRWAMLFERFSRELKTEQDSASFVYDATDSGAIDPTRRQAARAVTVLGGPGDWWRY